MQWNKTDGFEVIECEKGELQELIRSEDVIDSGEFVRCVCPRCKERNERRGNLRYDKKNLSINKECTWGKCFRCEAVFRDKLAEFSREVELDALLSPHEEEFELCRIDTRVYDGAEFVSNVNEGGIYMHNRNKFYDIRQNFCRLKFKAPKIIIPYFDLHQRPYYYQFRYIDVNLSPTGSKYFNPPIDKKPVYIVPNFNGRVEWSNKNITILVEGALTAIALKIVVGDAVNVVALLGKVPTVYQIQLLQHLGLFGKVYSMMDETKLSEDVVKKLRDEGIRSDIIPSSGADSEELLMQYGLEEFRRRIKNCLDSGIRVNFDKVCTTRPCKLIDATKPLQICVSF